MNKPLIYYESKLNIVVFEEVQSMHFHASEKCKIFFLDGYL